MLAAGIACAVATRALIASGRLSDETSLLIAGAVAVSLVAAAALGVRYALRQGATGARAVAALLPTALLIVCAVFVNASMIDASVEMEAIVQENNSPTPPTFLVLGPDGQDIRLSGELREGVAHRLAVLLVAHPDVKRIHLTSEGGLADEGQAIGDVIAAHGLTTFVPDYCVSACTLAFVRGRERLVLDDARVGFHAPFEEGLFGALYRGDGADQRAAYLAAGITPSFVDAALKVDPDGIWYPTDRQLVDARVVTRVVGHYDLPDSNLDGATTLEGARALVLRNAPITSVFSRRAPQALDKIAGWYLDGYRRSLSEGEDRDRLKAAVHSAVIAGLARADDQTLVELARFLQRGMAATDDPEVCTEIAAETDLLEAAEQIATPPDAGRSTAVALLDEALAGPYTLVDAASPAPTREGAGEETATSCAGWRQRYDAMLLQPPGPAAARMRALVRAQAYRLLASVSR